MIAEYVTPEMLKTAERRLRFVETTIGRAIRLAANTRMKKPFDGRLRNPIEDLDLALRDVDNEMVVINKLLGRY